MIDIGKLYEDFSSMYNTHQGGFFRPVRDFVPAVHQVSLDIWNTLAPKVNKNQKAKDLMRPFIRTLNVVVEKKDGEDFAAYPKDYVYYSSTRVRIQNGKTVADNSFELCCDGECRSELGDFKPVDDLPYEEYPADNIDDSRWAAVLKHRTNGPRIDNVKVSQKDGGFKVAPSGIGVLVVSYYVAPEPPVFAYDPGVGDLIVYNKERSKQLLWDDVLVPVFLRRLGVNYGLFTKDNLPIQTSQLEIELL